MKELKPTEEHLNDPYVIQLIKTIAELQEKLDEMDTCNNHSDGTERTSVRGKDEV